MASTMECVVRVVLGVAMRRSIGRLHEVVAMAVELGTALLVAVRFSGMVFNRAPPPASSSSSESASGSTRYYYYSPVAASMVGMSRIDRH